MPKGADGIPSLRLEVLNKAISLMPTDPTMFFSGLFPSVNYDSDTIKWEIEYGSSGMTPFVAPGSVAPTVGLDGVGQAEARAAYWKEKSFLDEELLNNLRKVGTWAEKDTAERKLARQLQKLRFRCDRRREWMMAKAITAGAITYQLKGGSSFTVSYGIPSTHVVTLAADRYWTTGANRNPVEDIFDAVKALREDSGVSPSWAVCNSELIKVLMLDPKMQALLMKSAFGQGDLFARPAEVIATLLGLPNIKVYDELYEVQGWLTANVGSTTIYVDDASDFEVGGTARFIDMSSEFAWEDETITAVDKTANTITVAAQPSLTLKGNEDQVVMRKKFIGDTSFIMFAQNAEGVTVAETMNAPYGIPTRYGMFTDTKDEWDPEGVYVRVQNKGLPVIYRPDCIYTLTVG